MNSRQRMTGASLGIFANFLDLPPLCEHVTGLDGLRQRILDAGNDDVDHLGVLADGLEFIVELIEGDGGDAFGFVEIELNFLLGGQRMHHVGNAAHQIDGVEQVNGLRAVGHGDGDLVALPDANGFQCLGAGLHLLHQLLVGGGLAHEVKGNVIGVFFGNGLHSLKHGAFKIVKVHGHTAHGVFAVIVSISNLPLPVTACPAAGDFPAAFLTDGRFWRNNSRRQCARRWSDPDRCWASSRRCRRH